MLARIFKKLNFKTQSKYITGCGYLVSVSNGTDAFNGKQFGEFLRIGKNSYQLDSGHTIDKDIIAKVISQGVEICW